MLELTITMPDADAPSTPGAAHWTIRAGGDLVAGDVATGPAPALAALAALLLALVELERPESDPAAAAAVLVEQFDGGCLHPDAAGRALARALESDGAALVAAALVAAGAWPPPARPDWVADALRAQRQGGQNA